MIGPLDAIRFDLAGVYSAALGERSVPGHLGLLLASRELLDDLSWQVVDLAEGKPVDRTSLSEIDNPPLARQGLSVHRYPAAAKDPADPAAGFRAALLAREIETLAAAVRWCQDHLASRRSGAQRLSAHPVVAFQMAAVVAGAAALRAADLPAALGDATGRRWLTGQIDDVALGLIKMAGGRALLAGHMVQLRTTLLYANRIYLAGD